MKYLIPPILMFFIAAASFAQQLSQESQSAFTLADAESDSLLSGDVRAKFDDDDGRPLKSVSLDLNGDGMQEKFVPNEFLCGNGGCPWIIYDPHMRRVLGRVDGKFIIVDVKKDSGYSQIETFMGLGGGEGDVLTYAFSKGQYKRIGKVSLKGSEVSEYFKKHALTK